MTTESGSAPRQMPAQDERLEAVARALFAARGGKFWDAPENEFERQGCLDDAAEHLAMLDAARRFDAPSASKVVPAAEFMWPGDSRHLLGYPITAPVTRAILEAAIRAPDREPEPLTECQASLSDGECVHRLCPARKSQVSDARGADPSVDCPLPWLRMKRCLDDEA